MKYTTYNF